MTDFQIARTNMVDSQIHTAGVVSLDILNAFETVPRECFVPEVLRKVAYNDEDINLGGGRFLLEPVTHARMVQAVGPQAGDLVLDIGGATGYSAAILSSMVSTVVALDLSETMLQKATKLWGEMGVLNVISYAGDMAAGNPANAPFNLIFMNGAVSEIPLSLVAQLEEGGRLITIVKKRGDVLGQVTLVKRLSGGDYSTCNLFTAGCTYLPGFEPQPEFQF